MSLTTFCKIVTGLIITAWVGDAAMATVFFTDDFAYPNGQLTAADSSGAVGTGANVSGGNWVNHSALSGFIPVLDGAAILAEPGLEDANRVANATLPTGMTWYYAARLSVADLRDPVGAGAFNDAYFMHLKDSGTVNFRGRLFVTAGTDPSKFTFGVTSSSSSPTAAAAKWAADLNFGTEYTVVVAYTADDDDSNAGLVRDGFTDLWVNPTTVASAFVTDTTPNANVSSDLTSPMSALALRQSQNPAGPATVSVNKVSIGDNFAEVLAAVAPVAANNADFDNDNDVDGNDFLIWQRGLGLTAQPTKSTGDANGDMAVNAADLAVWKSKFGGAPASAVAGAVPEPTSALIITIVAAVLGQRRRSA